MIGEHLPYCEAPLGLTAEVPKGRRKSCLRSQPAWLLDQDTGGNVSCSHKIAEVKSRPRLVDPRFMAAKRSEALRLLFIVSGLAEIAGVAVKHACHMIVARAAGADSNRLLACSHGIVVAVLKQARIAERYVSHIAVRVNCESFHCAFQRCVIGCRPIALPTKANLVGQREPQHAERRCIIRV